MGLNWSEGLKAGAQGLALLQRSSEQKTDIIYKQISQANMQRFQTEQAEADRAWRAGESEKQRTQALSMAETQEAATSTRHAESLASRERQTQAQLEANSAYQIALTGGRQTVADQNSYEADLAQINTDYEAAISGADFFDPKAKIPIEADKARKIEAITLRRDNPDGHKRYTSLHKQFSTKTEEQKQKAHELSIYYGSLDDESAAALKADISAKYKAQPKGKKSKPAAIDDAIRAHQAANDSFTQTGGPQEPPIDTKTGGGETPPDIPTAPTVKEVAVDLPEDKVNLLKTWVGKDTKGNPDFTGINSLSALDATLDKYKVAMTAKERTQMHVYYRRWLANDRVAKSSSSLMEGKVGEFLTSAWGGDEKPTPKANSRMPTDIENQYAQMKK